MEKDLSGPSESDDEALLRLGKQNVIHDGVFFGGVVQVGIYNEAPETPFVQLNALPPELVEEDLIGRDQALEDICTKLSCQNSDTLEKPPAICVVTGAPSVGKSALAVHAADRLKTSGAFPGGHIYLSLYDYDPSRRVTPFAALALMLRALGVPNRQIPPEEDARRRFYVSRMAELDTPEKAIVIIFDDVARVDTIQTILPRLQVHRIIITSRNNIIGLPRAQLKELRPLDAEHSKDLLEKRLANNNTLDTRAGDDPTSLREIAKLCDGLPLALHMAADLLIASAETPLTKFARLLRDARERLPELEAAGRGLRRAFELSYNSLDSQSATMFRLLGVHPGRQVTVDDAAVMLGVDNNQASRIIRRLRGAHLVQLGTPQHTVWMHDLIREFAQRCASQHPDETNRALERIVRNFAAVVGKAVIFLDPYRKQANKGDHLMNNDDTLAWLDQRRNALVASVDLALRLGRRTLCIELALDLAPYLALGAFRDEWLTTAHVAARATNRTDRAFAPALTNLGNALYWNRHWEEAASVLEQAARHYCEQKVPYGEPRALAGLANPLRVLGRHDEALEALKRAEQVAREQGDQHARAAALAGLGQLWAECPALIDLEAARTALNEARRLYAAWPDPHGEATTLTNLGYVLWHLGETSEAFVALAAAADKFRVVGNQFGEALVLTSTGNAHAEIGQLGDSIAFHVIAARTFLHLNDRYGYGRALSNLADALLDPRLGDEAGRIDALAYEILRKEGHQHGHNFAIIRRSDRFGVPRTGDKLHGDDEHSANSGSTN